MRRTLHRGFTLLEIMVVVAIIGIFVGVTVLSTDLVAFDRRLEQQANRLGTLLDFAIDEALLQSQDLGLLICEDSYHFFIFDYERDAWVPYLARPFGDFPLEEDMIASLRLDDREVILETAVNAFPREFSIPPSDEDLEEMPEPQIFILSSGEITPFQLELLRESDPLAPGITLNMAFNGDSEVLVSEF